MPTITMIKPHPEYPHYRITTCGAVIGPRRPLRGECDSGGYRRVSLSIGSYRVIHKRVGVLVLETYVGPRPEGHFMCHGPLGKECNELHNLYWGTQPRNEMDKHRDGTAVCGEKHYRAKLTEDDVRYIRESDEPGIVLAARFGLRNASITNIRKRRTWRHVT